MPAATAQSGTEIQIFQPAEDHVETESTYSSQFKRWPIEYKGASKRGDGHRLPVTPFEGGSTYSDAYKPLVQQQKYVRPKPPSNFPPQPHAAPLQFALQLAAFSRENHLKYTVYCAKRAW